MPQPVKIFADAGTQVELISESPDGANPGPSGHSKHVKDDKNEILGEFTSTLNQVDFIKHEKRTKF